jgi:chemotaxis signal transduction protein/CheY-like chemotaxis protein
MSITPDLKILLVEDAATMRKMEAKILNQAGFTNLVEAGDGREAMDKLQSEADIGLVISDWSMPHMDGLALVQWVRDQQQFKDLPFLMATGHGDKEYVARALESGAHGVAHKQFLSSEIWEKHPCCVVVFRSEIIDQYPQAVQEFTNMMVAAGQAVKENIEQAAGVAVNFLDPEGKIGLSPDLLKNVLSDPAGIVYDDLYPVKEDLATIQEYMTQKMGIGRPIDLDVFIDPRFATEACKGIEGQAAGQRSAALKLTDFKKKQALSSREGKYLVFNLANERYGLGILDVKEIIGMMDIHELPHMPPFFKGVINLRNQVIPVMDLRLKFGMEEIEHTDRTCIIIVEISGVRGSTLTGIIVDSVSEVVNIKDEQIADVPALGAGVDKDMIPGIAKLEQDVTILLDIDRLMHASEVVEIADVTQADLATPA